MSLVLHVRVRNRQGNEYAFPFEVDPSYYFDTDQDAREWLDSGRSLYGKRLWLDHPMPSNFFGLEPPDPELNIPDKVRPVVQEASWVLHHDREVHIAPWISGRVVRFED